MGNLLCLCAVQALHCSPLLHNVLQYLRLHCSTFYIQHSASTTHWIVYIVHIVCICIVAQHGVRPLLCLLCARVCIVLVFQLFCPVFVFCICRVGHHCVRPLLCLLSVHVLCLSTLMLLTNTGHEMAYIYKDKDKKHDDISSCFSSSSNPLIYITIIIYNWSNWF